jgi:DNA repair protein RadB
MGSDEGAQAANKELSKQLSKLMKIAKKYAVPVVVTNQVYSSFSKDAGSERLASVGGDVLKYWTKVVIQVAKSGRYRTATVIRHQHMPEGIRVRFRITEEGICDESIIDNRSVEV